MVSHHRQHRSPNNRSQWQQAKAPSTTSQTQAHEPAPSALPEIEAASAQHVLSASHVLQLQRTIGNRATNLVVQGHFPRISRSAAPLAIQRLIVPETFYIGRVPNDPADFKKSMPYRQFMQEHRLYEMFARSKKVSQDGVGVLQGRLNKLFAASVDFHRYLTQYAITMVQNSTGIAQRNKPVMINSLMDAGNSALDDANQEMQGLQFLLNSGNLNLDMTWSQALMLARTGTLPSSILTEENLAPGVDGNAPGNPKELSGGQSSVPTALDFQKNSGTERGVFKANESIAPAAPNATIADATYSAIRAMCVARVEQLIQFKMLLAEREWTSLNGNFDFAMYKGKLGTVAEFAKGDTLTENEFENPNSVSQTATVTSNVNLKDVELQRQLANLQLFDILTGQVDRNFGNIKVDQGKDKKTKVTGIDVDFAFSTESDVSKSIGKTTLPIFVDRYFAEAVLEIGPEEFEAALKGLRRVEIDAALTRLTGIQQQLGRLLAQNQLIVGPADKEKYPGARSWDEIQPGEYRYSSFLTGKTDYMGSLAKSQQQARDAMRNNLNLKPIMRNGKWVIKYKAEGETEFFLSAREPDGKDLWDMYHEVHREVLGVQFDRGRQRGTGFRIGNRT